MTVKLLRLAYACEFLIAVVAVFTAWSEIGGQAALDLMPWFWKFGFGLALAGALVAYTAAIVSEIPLWTMRSARWLTIVGVLVLAMSILTYYYTLEEDTGDSDDSGTAALQPWPVSLPVPV
jgi:hypothetical protein